MDGFHRGDDLAAGILHQHQRRNADVLDRAAIGFAHLRRVEDSHRINTLRRGRRGGGWFHTTSRTRGTLTCVAATVNVNGRVFDRGARGHLGVRSRVPLRRRRLRDAAHVRRPALPLRSPHAAPAQFRRDADAAGPADRRRDGRALPRDDDGGAPRRRTARRGVHPHPAHAGCRRALVRSRGVPCSIGRDHRQAADRPALGGLRTAA